MPFLLAVHCSVLEAEVGGNSLVRFEVFSQSRGVQEALVARVTLQWLCLVVSVYLVMLGQAVFRGKALVAEAALMDSLWHRSPRRGRLIFCFTRRSCLRWLLDTFWGPSFTMHSHVLHQLCLR